MSLAYLVALVLVLGCLTLIDHRWSLFLFAAPARAASVLVLGVAFFLFWDLAGIALGVFFRGETVYMTGLQIAPELPVEEVLFLTMLCHLTMLLYTGTSRMAARSRW